MEKPCNLEHLQLKQNASMPIHGTTKKYSYPGIHRFFGFRADEVLN
jgi:hypothetical protein